MYIRTLTHYKSYIILQTKCKTNIESILKKSSKAFLKSLIAFLKIFESIHTNQEIINKQNKKSLNLSRNES